MCIDDCGLNTPVFLPLSLFPYDQSILCMVSSGILPINAHAKVNMLNLNYINNFIFYSSANRLSNDIHYN